MGGECRRAEEDDHVDAHVAQEKNGESEMKMREGEPKKIGSRSGGEERRGETRKISRQRGDRMGANGGEL